MRRKIIVLTPVKNDEWILESFLRATSSFADHIILTDQNSTDKTLEIARSFSKVTIIKNDSEDYNEATRQYNLITTARKLYGAGNIVLAIDSDEVISYNSLQSTEWNEIHKAKPGTVLFFEKPTFYKDLKTVIRYKSAGGWPLGFIDGGAEYKPTYIHTTRVPFDESSPKLYLNEIKFLHCNLLSLPRQRSKIRYYCMVESIGNGRSWYHRTQYYNRRYNYANEGDGLMRANPEWTEGWINDGVILSKPKAEQFYWYDKECLQLFSKKGSKRFWMEDVWDVNWKEARDFFNLLNPEIVPPPRYISFLRSGIYYTIKSLFVFKESSLKLRRLFLTNS